MDKEVEGDKGSAVETVIDPVSFRPFFSGRSIASHKIRLIPDPRTAEGDFLWSAPACGGTIEG